MKILQEKEHFVFGKNLESKTGILVYKRTHSNIFITFMDLKKKVVVCKSSGICKVGYSRKKKIAPQAIEQIVNSLIKFLNIYKIKFVRILLKVRVSVHVFNLIRLLGLQDIKVQFFCDIKRFAHNGLRGRNFRRV